MVGAERCVDARVEVRADAGGHVGRAFVDERLDEALRRAAHVAEVDEVDPPASPNRVIAAGRSSVIIVMFPWQNVIPLAGLGWSSNTRS